MRNALTALTGSLGLFLLVSACTEATTDTEEPTVTPETATVAEPAPVEPASSVQHCFRNETVFGEDKDVEELTVTIDGDAATGDYNWLPAFKDQRLGQFSGTVDGDTISATYEFAQERTDGIKRDHDQYQ